MHFTFRKLRYSASLIGALALLFTGCSDPEIEQAEALVDSTTISPGEECEFGGEKVEAGLDLDGDGVLSEDEVTFTDVICFEAGDDPETPEALNRISEIEPGEECEAGGWVLEYGVDASGDGELGDDEIDNTEILCREPGLACDDRDELELEFELESNDLDAYFIGESYALTVEFNQEIEAENFSWRSLEESVGNIEMDGELDGEFWRGTWAPHQDYPGGQHLHLVMTDDCSLTALSYLLPQAREEAPAVHIWADADHLEASGESTEVCWTSAFVDECNLSTYDEDLTFNEELDVELEGCRDFTVDNELTISIECFDTTEGGMDFRSVTVLAGPQIHRFSNTATGFNPPSSTTLTEPGEVELFWETTLVESCELDNEIESVDVPTEQMGEGYPLMVDETATLTLSCEGLSGESISREFVVIVESDVQPGDYGPQQGYIDIIADNQIGVGVYLQDSVGDIGVGGWVQFSSTDIGAEIHHSSNCLMPDCDGGAEFDCESFDLSVVRVEMSDFHVFAWDGIFYVEDDVNQCTDVYAMENIDLDLTICVGPDESGGVVSSEQCMQVAQVNPVQSSQVSIIMQSE